MKLLLPISFLALASCVTHKSAMKEHRHEMKASVGCADAELKIVNRVGRGFGFQRDRVVFAYEAQGCDRVKRHWVMCPEGTTLKDAGALCSRTVSPVHLASFELDCPVKKLRATLLTNITVGIAGCGKRATYTYDNGDFLRSSASVLERRKTRREQTYDAAIETLRSPNDATY